MFDLAKEHYFEAQARRDRLRSTASLLVAIIAVIGSASAYLFDRYTFGAKRAFLPVSASTMDVLFSALLLLIGCLILFTILQLIYLLSSRQKYEEVGALPKVLKYKEDLEDYCKRRHHRDAEREFRRDMAARYSEAAERNRGNNLKDLARIKWASLLCGIAGLLVLISSFVYAGNKLDPEALTSHQKTEEPNHGRSEQPDRPELLEWQANPTPQQGNQGRGRPQQDTGRQPSEP